LRGVARLRKHNQSIGIGGIILLAVFAVAIFVDGQYSANTSEMVTVRIDGIDSEGLSQKIIELIRKIEGVQTVLFDEKSALCTFRYDSGKTDLKTVESQLAGLGIKFCPLESVNILEIPESGKKFFSIKIESASN